MQKRIIGIIFLGIFFLTGIANAGIISLPRYNPDMNQRSSSGGITRTCARLGMVDKPTDPCQICQGAVGDCCTSISCSTSSECYQYSAADASKYICSGMCTDGNGTHYKTCKYRLTCSDVNGLTSIEANPYISAGFSCSQTRTTCTVLGTVLGPCTQSSVVNGGSSSGGLVSGGSLGGSLGGIGSSDRQSITCYTCLCPAGTTSEPEEGKTCTPTVQHGNITCYSCEDNICPLGTYGEDCIPCPTGTYSNTVGASSCKDCPAGYKSKSGVTGATSMEAACEICPEGTYKTTVGSGSCTPCPTGYVAISGVTGATSMAQACTKACIKCSTAMYPLLTCPSHAVCEECTPKNCEDNTTRYKISYCEDGYKQSGTSCVAKTCEELGYLSSIPSGQNCTPITTTAGRCYTNCSNQYSTCQEWLNATGHNAIVVTGSFNAIVKQGKYDEILYSSDKEISSTYIGPSQQYNVTIAPASIYEQESGGLCKSAVKSLYLEDFSAYNSTVKIMDTKLRIDNLTSEGGVFNLVMSDDSSLEVGENISASVGSIEITGGSIVNDIGDIYIQNSNYVNIRPDTSNNFFQGISIVGEDSSLSAKIVNVDDISLSQGASLNLTQARSIYDIYVSTILNYCSSCGISIGTPGEDVVIENGIRMEAPGDYRLTIYGNVSMGGNLDVVKSGIYAPEYPTWININGTLDMNNNDVLLNGGLQLSVSGHGKLLNPSSIVINLPPDSTYGAYDYAVELNEIYITVENGGAIKMGGVCRMLGSDTFARSYRNKCSCTSVVPSCYCPGNMTVTSLSQMYDYASDSYGYPIKGTPLSSMGSSCSY